MDYVRADGWGCLVIPLTSPVEEYEAQKDAVQTAVMSMLAAGHYILGPEVKKFEEQFAKYLGVKYAVGVNSGTDALILAMKALGIQAGDEVITVSHTALATISAIVAIGATPVIVDIRVDDFTMNLSQIESVISSKTKAIIPVHIYGHMAQMDTLLEIGKRYNIPVIEDCAQSTGAKLNSHFSGSMGQIGCFSFYPTKNLGAIGDGGAVVTNDPALYESLKRLRQYGWDENRETKKSGLNSRLDELQATILNVKLARLNEFNQRRRDVAAIYERRLSDLPLRLPIERPGFEHVYHLYVVRTPKRNELKEFLLKHGIQTGVHYLKPAHMNIGYQELCSLHRSKLEVTEAISHEILSLPMYSVMKLEDAEFVSETIRSFFSLRNS